MSASGWISVITVGLAVTVDRRSVTSTAPPDELFVVGTTAEVTPVVRHATSASAGVLDYLEEVDASLLVLGTHGRRGFRRWLMGSVAEEVVRCA